MNEKITRQILIYEAMLDVEMNKSRILLMDRSISIEKRVYLSNKYTMPLINAIRRLRALPKSRTQFSEIARKF